MTEIGVLVAADLGLFILFVFAVLLKLAVSDDRVTLTRDCNMFLEGTDVLVHIFINNFGHYLILTISEENLVEISL